MSSWWREREGERSWERDTHTESLRENIHTYPAFPVRKIAHKVVNRADADTEQGIHDHERHCRLQRSSSKRHPVSLPAHFPKYISPAHLRHTHTHTHTQIPEEQKNFNWRAQPTTLKFSGFHPDAKKKKLRRTNPFSRTHKQATQARTWKERRNDGGKGMMNEWMKNYFFIEFKKKSKLKIILEFGHDLGILGKLWMRKI